MNRMWTDIELAEDTSDVTLAWFEEFAAMDDFDKVTKPKEEVNMETVKGIVEKINCNANGYYGVKLGETWYGAGKYAPKFNEGDEVQFGFTMNGKYANMDFKSVEVIAAGSGGASAPAPKQSGSTNSSSGGGTNWDLKDKRITFLASRKDALELAKLLIDNGGFTLPTAKAGKLEAVTGLVDELTDSYYTSVYGESFSQEG